LEYRVEFSLRTPGDFELVRSRQILKKNNKERVRDIDEGHEIRVKETAKYCSGCMERRWGKFT
jgi:hypothetical protein